MGESEQIESPACGNCVFPIWLQQQKTQAGLVSGGYCRRFPPVPLLKTEVVETKITRPGETPQPTIRHTIEPHFPPTTSDGWCGEHTTEAEYIDARSGVADETEASGNDAP